MNTKLIGCLLLAGAMFFTACTAEFEKFNTNPNEVTDEEMYYDNLNIGAYFVQMQKGVFIVGETMGGEYQITEILEGDIFASYFANITTFSYTTYHNDQYVLYYPWYDAPFNDAYNDIMQPWQSIADQEDETSVGLAMATVVKVLGMSRITDMYGPIPYSQFGSDVQVPYDSQKDVYYQFFDELDNAIEVMTQYAQSNSATYMETYDYVYQGNVEKWIKLANTLRLRLAMRISYVDETKAVSEAEAAINQTYGLMASTSDSAYLKQNTTFSFRNPLWEVSESFQDIRMSANMDCYLNGYSDPRISAYFRTAENDGAYHGVRNGLTGLTKSSYVSACSGVNYETGDDMLWMDASEAYFLLAEAQLRFGLGSDTAQNYYEQGISTSFSTWGASGADSYITRSDSYLPSSSYTDPVSTRYSISNTSSYLSMLPIAWDENATDEEKLERIMVQKWIALFPDGQEAWSEMRRTGYPSIIPIYSYSYQTEVADGELISRLKFPSTEYSNNSANVQNAISLLGGNDSAGTRLWWDVRR
ncbi:MAG: SusD/RagB family nutrient-binding outer membrane lipoprotein [Clostridia bacterium]|nr:SusD/RagB family nutrient-binding outer membrane lipoprotein [Clostridia bacterium]